MDSSVHRGEPVPIPAVEVYLDRQVTCLVDGVDGVDGVNGVRGVARAAAAGTAVSPGPGTGSACWVLMD